MPVRGASSMAEFPLSEMNLDVGYGQGPSGCIWYFALVG